MKTATLYRLFALDQNGTLWQLGSRGWVKGDGSSFPNIGTIRDLVYKTMIPSVDNEVDAFIATVDASGTIVETFSVLGD